MAIANFRLPKISLRFFNNCLTIIVAIFGIYIVAAPFLPQIGWWLKHDSPVRTVVGPQKDKTNNSSAAGPLELSVTGDGLFIPRLDMEEAIHGGGIGSLRKGVWHLPYTSTPEKGGNTVLVGHRFTYDGAAVFYHLDKVRLGDEITVRWQDKTYSYKVADIKVVPPTEISVEANTDDPQLTIYTCTPLLTAKDRLVIIAKPVEEAI